MSRGRGRTARSVSDQHTDNLIAELDYGPWVWGDPYKDIGSASTGAPAASDSTRTP